MEDFTFESSPRGFVAYKDICEYCVVCFFSFCLSMGSDLLSKFPDILPALVNIADLSAVLTTHLDTSEPFRKVPSLTKLRFDDHLTCPVDITPVAPLFNPYPCQSFGKTVSLMKLRLDNHLTCLVDIAPFAPLPFATPNTYR